MFISITSDCTAYISDEFKIPDILTLRLYANRQMEVLAIAKSMMPNCYRNRASYTSYLTDMIPSYLIIIPSFKA